MTTKSFTSSSVKAFFKIFVITNLWNIKHYYYNRNKILGRLEFLKQQVEKYLEIDRRMKPEDLVYGKHNFNICGTVIAFVSIF